MDQEAGVVLDRDLEAAVEGGAAAEDLDRRRQVFVALVEGLIEGHGEQRSGVGDHGKLGGGEVVGLARLHHFAQGIDRRHHRVVAGVGVEGQLAEVPAGVERGGDLDPVDLHPEDDPRARPTGLESLIGAEGRPPGEILH